MEGSASPLHRTATLRIEMGTSSGVTLRAQNGTGIDRGDVEAEPLVLGEVRKGVRRRARREWPRGRTCLSLVFPTVVPRRCSTSFLFAVITAGGFI